MVIFFPTLNLSISNQMVIRNNKNFKSSVKNNPRYNPIIDKMIKGNFKQIPSTDNKNKDDIYYCTYYEMNNIIFKHFRKGKVSSIQPLAKSGSIVSHEKELLQMVKFFKGKMFAYEEDLW